jgi:group I intron endonuclease
MILNCVDNKGYIGSSLDVGNRLLKHIEDLKAGVHHNASLGKAWNRSGPEAFVVSLLEAVVTQNIVNRERYFIELLDTYANGYNQTSDGGGSQPMPSSLDADQKRIDAKSKYAAQRKRLAESRSSPIKPAQESAKNGCCLLVGGVLLNALLAGLGTRIVRYIIAAL